MARISLEEFYSGEGNGQKYGIMGEVFKDILMNGTPPEYTEQTWCDMLLVKYTLIAAEKLKKEGDCVSEITDAQSLSFYAENCYEDT